MADRYTGLRDMFDGGGAGQSGARFEGGGLLSAAANAVARPLGSIARGEPDMRTGIGGFARDMVDGGGFGRSGPTFQGGLYSGLLNAAGVRPLGYMDRLGSVRPQMRPQRPTLPAYMRPAPAPAPAPAPFVAQPVVTPTVYQYPIGDEFSEMMARLQLQGIPSDVETPALARLVLAQSVAQQTPSNYQGFVGSNRTNGVLTPVRPDQMDIMPGLYARSPALMRARAQGRYGAPTYTYDGPR